MDIHTHKKKGIQTVTLKIVIKSQGKGTKEEDRNKKNYNTPPHPPKTMNRMPINTQLSVIT